MKIDTLYFFIGTEAELMKVFPVIEEAQKRNITCKIIANGQNDISGSPFLKIIGKKIDLDISKFIPRHKSAGGHFQWFVQTEKLGKQLLPKYFGPENKKHSLMVVHGDTLSTVMGSRLARFCRMPYVHIESGYRSYNFLSPFPEEFDRLYSSLHSVINFTVGTVNTEYAGGRFRGEAVDTVYNTGIETLFYALREISGVPHPQQPKGKFFLFMIHRQENLLSRSFMTNTAREIVKLSRKIPCVFIYHDQTKLALQKFGAYRDLEECDTITILPRQSYLDFIRLVDASQFVVTDGCGNQQEFYYLGKPYLIMRKQVEKDSEGLSLNAKVFGNDYSNIVKFYEEYPGYQRERIQPAVWPSKIIVDRLQKYFSEQN